MSAPFAGLEYVLSSGQRGRVFVPAGRIPQMDPDTLGRQLESSFVEADDRERLALAERALKNPRIVFEVYPGEAPPRELHAYIRAAALSESPIFACVVASRSVLETMLESGAVFETSSLEVIDGEVTTASLIAALERWARRVWPKENLGLFQIEPWLGSTNVVKRALERELDLQRAFPPRVATLQPEADAETSFVPAEDLVPPEFRFDGEAA